MEKNTSSSPSFRKSSETSNQDSGKSSAYTSLSIPEITLPKGGGAIKSIDEKFQVNAANGTAGFTIGFPFSPSRNGFMPSMALSYNSGSGNGVFGLGWNSEAPSITRKTERKLPEYNDDEESDTFVFSGAEDLVPALKKVDDNWIKDESPDGSVKRYNPRTEGVFARIEKVIEPNGNVYWKVISKDNIISVFGKSKAAQISDPNNQTKIFNWLLEFSCDDKGNCFQFEYKKEDRTNVPNDVHEKNRWNDLPICTNTYLKRIKYCNKAHFNRLDLNFSKWETLMSSVEYLLELVLDYGEHDLNNPPHVDNNGWLCRQDAFSEYRAGFEIRTYRICRRVLMFHHFTELGEQPCLVRSLDLEYEEGTAFTFLKSASQKGYIRNADNTYSVKSLPPLEFDYEPLGWNTKIKSLPKESLENLPIGIDDQSYQWIDLYSEGLSGILTEQANAWYYKSNSGDGNFDALKLVSPKPSFNGLSVGAVHFQDIEANGQKHLVSNDLNGYYEFTPEDEWLPFRNFNVVPNIDLRDPNLKFLDLNGDGKADILISEDDVFTWYASKGKLGFDDYRLARKSKEEEKGPNIVFADSTQSIVLADMSGDGLMDIVRIRNCDIAYWPNLGYGRFGAKASMSNAPLFDNPDHFNPNYLKLADLDGSGTTDIVYLGKDSFKIYFNQSGNSWSEENIIHGVNPIPFLKIDDHANVNIIDLLGNGTGCIVWSSPLPKHSGNPLRYIDLMGGKKPHIMTGYKNNMGKEVNFFYKPSTYYYLDDKKNGNPWITKLPFPVQCVSQVEMIDQVRKSTFTNLYSYHHGYYDYTEREFRGFGRVDQSDTEDYENYKKHSIPGGGFQIVDEGFHEPPVLTKTWFHTGAFIDKEKILTQFAHEYYQNAAIPENILAEPALPGDVTIDEWREALRSCKGIPLHVEVYSMDGSDKQDHPYTTAQHTCLIQLMQPKLDNEHAVFMVLESEALSYTYERNPADPRIAHSMNIEVDEFGNVLKAAAISYGRKTTDADLTESEQAEQSKTHIIFSENNFTNTIDDASAYRLPLLYEAKTFELTGINPETGNYFSIEQIRNDFQQANELAYQLLPTEGQKEKRLIEHVHSVFLKNDLSSPLQLGEIESLALPYQSYKLALTTTLMQYIYGEKVNDDLLLNEGKYFHFNDGNYWIASGTQTYDAAHFYQVIKMFDPFGYKAEISYDATYHCYVQKTTDELENSSEILKFSFRTLSPYLTKDINDNRAGVRADELGMVMSTFVMGKENENKGDLFDINAVEASEADKPGSTLEYDLFKYINTGKPNYVKTKVNEIDYFYSIEKNKPIISQTAYIYYCGGGNEVMRKVQAEPGIALQENEDGTVRKVDTSELDRPQLRWVGTGRTLINNKSKPVKQYEPYFSINPDYEDAKLLVERGVTPIIYYDSAGRVIKTELPDGTFSKVEFDAWRQRSFDPNDTVMESEWYKNRIIEPDPDIATPQEIAAANKAAIHADTPVVVHTDSLGRPFYSIAHNKRKDFGNGNIIEEFYGTHSVMDIEGNLKAVIDACGNTVMQYKYDMLGTQLYQMSMDAGERWIINDCMGKLISAWDSKDQQFVTKYDSLHRPSFTTLTKNSEPVIVSRMEYVDTKGLSNVELAAQQQLNLIGKSVTQYDDAGVTRLLEVDFKGNALETSRHYCKKYKTVPDWVNISGVIMEEEIFISSGEFDALNRPVKMFTPNTDDIPASVIVPAYNEAGLLNNVTVNIRGNDTETVFVKDINYDAKGQRESIRYGNNTLTRYTYDPKTFRLTQLSTTGTGNKVFQDLHYTYDPVGNIIQIHDNAFEPIFFNNQRINALSEYDYDAIYQLIRATGREHAAQNNINETATNNNRRNFPFENRGISLNDVQAIRNYSQQYLYDAVGNILQMQHAAGDGSWTRNYWYNNTDIQRNDLSIDPATVKNNQLLQTQIGNDEPTRYAHDIHGNMQNLPQLQGMTWNYKDQLQQVDLGGGGKAYYVYDSTGQRIRKVIERNDGTKEERLYLGVVEIYRETNSAGELTKQTDTLHTMDNAARIAMVETIVVEDSAPLPLGEAGRGLIRYIYSNHLGSSSLELTDEDEPRMISYEEFHPYGTTAYSLQNTAIKAAAKRYRYTGMERDEETGLNYHHARYYAGWFGRWVTADPIGIGDNLDMYMYSNNNPLFWKDTNGKDAKSDIKLLSDLRKSEGNPDVFATELFRNYNDTYRLLGPSGFSGCTTDRNKLIQEFENSFSSLRNTDSKLFFGVLTLEEQERENEVQLEQLPNGRVFSGTKMDLEKAKAQAQYERDDQTYHALKDSPLSGSLWMKYGDLGADLGGAMWGVVSSFGGHRETPEEVTVEDFENERGAAGKAGHGYAKKVLPGGTGKAIAGHGEYRSLPNDKTTVPEGTTITIWTGEGSGIKDRMGQLIESGDFDAIFATPEFVERMYQGKVVSFRKGNVDFLVGGAVSHLPGAEAPNITLLAPSSPGLTILENSTTVEDPTPLSNLLEPNMGHMHWAACFAKP
jgi:RHS repeat-associated protein